MAPEREHNAMIGTHSGRSQPDTIARDTAIGMGWGDATPGAEDRQGLLVLDGHQRVIYCSHSVSALLGLGQTEIISQGLEAVLRRQRIDEEAPELFDFLMGAAAGTNSEPCKTLLTLSGPLTRELPVTMFTVVLGPNESVTALLFDEVSNDSKQAYQWATMIGILAHELHNPLTVIKSYSDLLFFESPLNPIQKQWINNIRISIDRMAALGSGLVSTARKGSSVTTVDVDQLTLGECLAGVVDELADTVTSHRFSVQIPVDLPTVAANRLWVEQVLRNLLDNAVKYSPGGGQVTVEARFEAGQNRMVVGVSDQGIGIALEDQARIFLPSERVTRRETNNIWGVGLGLFIVKELVELMGGEVWIESELYGGSTFFFSLPGRGHHAISEPSAGR